MTAQPSQPPSYNQNPEPEIEFLPSAAPETSTASLQHLIPDDAAGDEPGTTTVGSTISLMELFNFRNNGWVDLYNEYASHHLAEELSLCELLNKDAATDEGAEVDVNKIIGEILID